jgi:hypothetical protein
LLKAATRKYSRCSDKHCRHGQKYTSTSICTSHDILPPIEAGKPGQVNLEQLPSKIQQVCQCIGGNKKHHNTAGLYLKLVRVVVENMVRQRQSVNVDRFTWEGDAGGYRDVGTHTDVVPLSTCWPLVEQVFRFLADQVCPYLGCSTAISDNQKTVKDVAYALEDVFSGSLIATAFPSLAKESGFCTALTGNAIDLLHTALYCLAWSSYRRTGNYSRSAQKLGV